MQLRKAATSELTSLGVMIGVTARVISVARSLADSNIVDRSSGALIIGGPKALVPGQEVRLLQEPLKNPFCCPVNPWRNIAASLSPLPRR
jgi:hypothetical protein